MIKGINVTPFEFVSAGFEVQLEAEEALNAQSAQSAIRLQGQRATIALTGAGTKAAVRTASPLAPGRHLLEVENLLGSSGRALDDRVVVPFFVVDTKARLPKALRVEGYARLAVRGMATSRLSIFTRPRGAFIDILKAVHRVTGAPRQLAFDQDGRTVDADRVLRAAFEARLRRYGKLQPALFERLSRLGARARVDVAVWLKHDDSPEVEDKRPDGETTAPSDATRARSARVADLRQRYLQRADLAPLAARMRGDTHAPVVFASMSAEEVRRVAADASVAAVFLVDRAGKLDLDDSVKIANADDVHAAGVKGSGVKVAVFEPGPDTTADLSIAGQYDATPTGTTSHARLTHAIIKNKQATGSKGFAPDCSLYSANSYDLDAVRWAAEQGCTVISQSFHRGDEPHGDGLNFDDVYKDWLALRWPFPTIVQAAGNYWEGDDDDVDPPEDEYVNHKGYNTLVVGNHDDTAGAMSGSSVFRNPSSTHGDRELPEICANGTGVSAAGTSNSGTSFAAPAVAGCAALIQGVSATLKSWPEGCRAILLAGAKRNVKDSTWWRDVSSGVEASDGSGAVDAEEAVEITRHRSSRDNVGVRRGWDVGTLRQSDFNASTKRSEFVYRVTVPATRLGPRHVKVALAWDSKVIEFDLFGLHFPLASALTVDHDLQVYDASGNLVGYSGSWDNSYEIAEFEGKGGATYEIRVRRWSGTDSVWYGIAWTVTGGLEIAGPRPIDITRLPR